jgi:SulP family sulfate permease
MIAQTMLNIESGGRGKLSGVVEALCILAFIVCASALIGMIPMAALVGVMFVVVAKTFAWSTFQVIGKMPKSDAFALVLVSAVTVAFNLATAVAAGVVFCCLSFAWSNATRVNARRYLTSEDRVSYEIHGPLFFGSSATFQTLFNPAEDPDNITVDLRYTYLHDYSALAAVEALSQRYADAGKTLELANLSPRCRALLESNKSKLTDTIYEGEEQHVATDRLAPANAGLTPGPLLKRRGPGAAFGKGG